MPARIPAVIARFDGFAVLHCYRLILCAIIAALPAGTEEIRSGGKNNFAI